jgi:isoleucyl-tRNA synthetase
MIPVLNSQMKVQLAKMEDLIKAEVNIKEIEYITETAGVINKKIKANFKTLGAKLGASMKEAAALIAGFSQDQITEIEQKGLIIIQLSSGSVSIELGDVEIVAEDIPGWSVASKGALTVALDITITEELKNEGDARELVNRIQNIRKESGFELTDRIIVQLELNERFRNGIMKYNDYICREILADEIDWLPQISGGNDIEVNDIALKVVVNKKG